MEGKEDSEILHCKQADCKITLKFFSRSLGIFSKIANFDPMFNEKLFDCEFRLVSRYNLHDTKKLIFDEVFTFL